jgi:hypothetical protein
MTLHMTLARRCAAIAAALALAAPPAGALPPRGADAPEITAAGVDGQPVSTERFADQPLVLIFGEFDHEPTMQACAEVMDVLGEDRLRRPPGEAVVPILVVARQSAPAALGEHAAATRVPALVLHDPRREAFGAYRVLVIPSVVVVSGDRKVIYAAPGFLPRLRGLLRESLLVATGQQAPEQLDRALAAGDEGANGHESSRADRLIHLGEQLARHGMDEMAEARSGPANTTETIEISLIRMLSDGPEVSLNGSPTVSPTTVALWSSSPCRRRSRALAGGGCAMSSAPADGVADLDGNLLAHRGVVQEVVGGDAAVGLDQLLGVVPRAAGVGHEDRDGEAGGQAAGEHAHHAGHAEHRPTRIGTRSPAAPARSSPAARRRWRWRRRWRSRDTACPRA